MKKPFKLLLIGVAIIACSIGLLVVAGVLWVATATELPISESNKALVVRADDFVPYFEDFSASQDYESFEKVKYIDGSIELNYEYDSPSDDDPYIAVTITQERNRGDAKTTFSIEWSAQRYGMSIADSAIAVEEDDAFFRHGEQSKFGNILYEGEAVGHIFVTRKGNTVYAFTITGFLLDDSDLWRELFDQRLAKLDISSI